MSKITFPEGLKIQEKKGRDELKPLLRKLKRYSFSGYLRMKVNEGKSGYIILKDGYPKNAVLYEDNDEIEKGEKALDILKELSKNEDTYLAIHTKIDVDRLLSSVGDVLEIEKEAPKEKLIKDEEEIRKMIDLVGAEEEDIVEESLVAEEIDKKIKKQQREERELEVYNMIIKDRLGEKRDDIGEFPEKFSFDNFVVGEKNELAYSSAKKVSENPGLIFNPLFIWSKTGLGKTHLLKA
ncbi:MAG: DnaA ATPase domain-containing protein, partial [Thermoplasmatota archaeon]